MVRHKQKGRPSADFFRFCADLAMELRSAALAQGALKAELPAG
jgi:hypothetical protein